MTTFSDAPWDGAASKYPSTDAYCAACMIDDNPAGKPKVQALCHLPYKEPGGAVNKGALRAIAAVLAGSRGGVKGVSAAAKKAAMAKLDGLMRQAKMGKYAQGK